MPDVRGGILLLEDINEQNGILDRWITSLYLSGDLQYANAVACGSFENCGITDSYNMLSVMDTFADRMKYLGKTACFGLPFGQHDDTAVVAIGVHARLDAGAGRLDFLESAVNH
jgi:muramoyltetrapeptide carboxypeptidase